ncbi:MAG: hypothetical protein V2A77_04810, partial [Pseudomonadota bacterium]
MAKRLFITDRNGNRLDLTYSGDNLTKVSDALGCEISLAYSGGHITEITYWAGRKHQYVYNDSDNLVEYRNPLAVAGSQEPVRYNYYPKWYGKRLEHAMKSCTMPRDNSMTYEYYRNGKVFRHTNTLGETNTFTYNEFRRETVRTNERGYTRHFFFDENGNLIKLMRENGTTRKYTYGKVKIHCLTSETSPEGYVTSYNYDDDGNLTRKTYPSGNYVENSYYNACGQPGKVRDARGRYTLMQYDDNGNMLRLLKLNNGKGASTDPTTYDPKAADIVSWTSYSYDAQGNRLKTTRMRDFAARIGPFFQNVYDSDHLNVVKNTRTGDLNGDGVIAGSEYYSADIVSDSLGRVTHGIDEDWYEKDYVYDRLDRVVRGTDAFGRPRDYTFDPNGNLLEDSLTVGGVVRDCTSYTFDLSDRKTRSTDAAGFKTT